MDEKEITKGLEELIAIVESSESIAPPKIPISLANLLSGGMQRNMSRIDKELTTAYYQAMTCARPTSSIKDMTVLGGIVPHEVLEIILAHGSTPNQEGRECFKRAVTIFAKRFGYNVEFTDR
jgi:hypothetical protein